MPTKKQKQDIILFLGKLSQKHITAVRDLEAYLGETFRIGLLADKKKIDIAPEVLNQIDVLVKTNTSRIDLIEDSLLEYRGQIAAITAKFENGMPLFARIAPLFPYLRVPTAKSLEVANDKFEMRKAFKKYAPHTIPRFIIVKNSDTKTLDEIESKVGYPCVVKPANLSKSIMVQTCYYRDELKATLDQTVKKISTLYKSEKVEHEPKILVEQLIEGKMYSVDVYVNSRGKLYFTPYMDITTGKDKGYDDFFMHSIMTPTNLTKEEAAKANAVVEDGIHALGLRSATTHVELYNTKDGFKIIEIGARTGGYRHELLQMAFGLNHHMNDLLIHLGKAPVLKKEKQKYAAYMKIYPRKSGTLKSLKGFTTITKEPFVKQYKQFKFPGDKVGPAKLGYWYIAILYLTADSRTELQGHIRKVEKTVETIL